MDRWGGERLLWLDAGWPAAEGIRRAWRGPLLEPWRVARSIEELGEMIEDSPPQLCLWHHRAFRQGGGEKELVDRLGEVDVPAIVAVEEGTPAPDLLSLGSRGVEVVLDREVAPEFWAELADGVLKRHRRRRLVHHIEETLRERDAPERLIGGGEWMSELRHALRSAAEGEHGVLWLHGARGTGMRRITRALQALRPDAGALQLGAADVRDVAAERLLGSERRPGALELVQRGTVLLDAPEVLSRAAFERIRRYQKRGVIESVDGERKVEGRAVLLVALHEPEAVQRLAADPERTEVLALPPLRERPEDFAALCEFFCRRSFAKRGEDRGIDATAIEVLAEYSWPGNLHELSQVLDAAVQRSEGPVGIKDLPYEIRRGLRVGDEGQRHFALPSDGVDISCVLADLLDQALQMAGGNKTLAAQLLGIHRDQVRYWVKKYGLQRWVRSKADPGKVTERGRSAP